MRSILFLLILLITTNCIAQEDKSTLDGKQYAIDIIEKGRIGKDDKMKDVIVFKGGKIYTKFSRDNGFPDAEYTTETKDGLIAITIYFKGSCKGKKDKLFWEGSISDNEIEGNAIRRRKGDIRTIYEFKGTLK
ncbi:MAG: hypothetical protein COA97_13405 [Flavobacteriales bacterium]|nr:MAG: hypothetical protein COA97_13405 [Flavobacteriales bacterium]